MFIDLLTSTHVLALARVQIDLKVGTENFCDKRVKNRQRSLNVLCQRFLYELGRTEGTLSSGSL